MSPKVDFLRMVHSLLWLMFEHMLSCLIRTRSSYHILSESVITQVAELELNRANMAEASAATTILFPLPTFFAGTQRSDVGEHGRSHPMAEASAAMGWGCG